MLDPKAPPESLDEHDAEDEERAALKWLHQRSGEVELLISAALLFGLAQLPGRMQEWWSIVSITLPESVGLVVFLLYFYVRVMVVTMLVGFALHLVARAYWVGLVGLDSVYPDGIDWDRVKYGPMAKSVYQKRLPSLPTMIRKADNFGSMIFSIAFLIIIMFVFSIGFGAIFGSLSWAISRWLLPGVSAASILVVMAMVAGTLPGLAIGTEKVLGERLKPDSRLGRLVLGTIAFYYRSSGGALYLPIQFTLFSRIPKSIVWPATVLLFAGLITTLGFTEVSNATGARYSADGRLPDRPGSRAVVSNHFADTRSPSAVYPFIQSDIIEGPYVRLTIPLSAAVYPDRLSAACPDLGQLGETGFVGADVTSAPPTPTEEASLLDCLGQIWSVALDGRSLAPEWDLAWTHQQGPSAIVAYLPTAELSPGAHVIEIVRAPHPDDVEDAEGAPDAEDADPEDAEPPPQARYFIRFRT
ncbi:MAG: hypothetical protein AAF389_07030 [Gemmatimonadota bacterium]